MWFFGAVAAQLHTGTSNSVVISVVMVFGARAQLQSVITCMLHASNQMQHLQMHIYTFSTPIGVSEPQICHILL